MPATLTGHPLLKLDKHSSLGQQFVFDPQRHWPCSLHGGLYPFLPFLVDRYVIGLVKLLFKAAHVHMFGYA